MKYLQILAQLGSPSDLNLRDIPADSTTFSNILGIVFMAVGALSVGFMIYGGLRYVVSAGSPEETRKAKDILVYAVAGLVVSILAFTVVNFVASRF